MSSDHRTEARKTQTDARGWLGPTLRRARKRLGVLRGKPRGLTQAQAATELSVDEKTVRRWENTSGPIDAKHIQNLSKFLFEAFGGEIDEDGAMAVIDEVPNTARRGDEYRAASAGE